MTQVYLLESKYGNEEYSEILFHIPNTDLWFGNNASSGESIENNAFTKLFWEKLGEDELLTRLGSL